jgi:hypothetical protein
MRLRLELGLLGLCALAASLSAQDTAATKRELLAYDKALAVRIQDGSSVGLLGIADANAAILIPGQPILRAVDAQQIFRQRYPAARYDWRPVAAIASADGAFGCTIGFSRMAGATPGHGSYVACWRREPRAPSRERQWKLVALQRSDSPREAPAFWSSKQLPAQTAPASPFLIYGSGPEQLTGAISADSAFAREAEKPEGPGPAFSHWAADDAWLLGASQPTLGKSKILAAFDGYPADRVLLWDPDRQFGYAMGGLAVTVGNSRTRMRDNTGTDINPGHYLTLWRQNADRTWSWIIDLGSPR